MVINAPSIASFMVRAETATPFMFADSTFSIAPKRTLHAPATFCTAAVRPICVQNVRAAAIAAHSPLPTVNRLMTSTPIDDATLSIAM